MQEAGGLRRLRAGNQHGDAHTLDLAIRDNFLRETQSQLFFCTRRSNNERKIHNASGPFNIKRTAKSRFSP